MIFRIAPQTPIGVGFRQLEQAHMIAATRTQARRQWIIRTSITLVVSSAILVFLIVLQADRMTIDGVFHSMDRSIAALRVQVDALGQLPSTLPGDNRMPIGYATDLIREYAKTATGPVIVASTPLKPLVLRSSGQVVIIYENGKLHREWWTALQFLNEWQAQEARIKAWDLQRRAAAPNLP